MIQYDGSKFLGWQIQKEGRTVQGVIEDNLKNYNFHYRNKFNILKKKIVNQVYSLENL